MARKWRRGSLGKTSLSGANHVNESTTPAQTSDNVQDNKDIQINQMNDERMSPTKEEASSATEPSNYSSSSKKTIIATTSVMVETPRTSTDITPLSSSGRSQRVRKKPKHLDNDDLEVDWGITGQSSYTKNANILFEKSIKKSSVPNQEQAAVTTSSPTISSDIENDLEQVDDDLPSLLNDDDPHKVWCNCRKPHGNRDMIECEACEYWFHIECVNVTKRQLKEYDKKKQDWFCSPCTAELGKGVTRRNLKRQTRLRISQLETQELAQREASLKTLKKQSLPLKNNSSGSKQNERATEDSNDSTMTDDDHFDGQGKASNKLSNTPKKEMKDRGELRLKKLIKKSKKELGQKQMKHMMKDSDSALVKETGSLEPSSLINMSTSDIHHDEEFSKEITAPKKDPLNTKHFPDQMENFFDNSTALAQGSTLYVNSATPSSSISQGNGSNQRSPYAGKSSYTLRRASTSSSTSLDNSSGQEVPCPACAKKCRLESELGSIFCNPTCVQTHVSDMLKMLRTHKKQKEKGNPVEAQKPLKVTLINRFNQTTLSGKDALLEKNVLQFVSKNPIYEVMSPSSVALISNKNRLQTPLVKGNSNVSKSQSVHRESNSGKTTTATQIKGDAKKTSKDSPGQKLERSSSLSGKEDHEQWARKQLKEIFELRYNELPEKYKKNGIKSNTEILNKLAEKIVDELKKTYSNKFLAKCRSLMFNLKDERNKGNLCRRVILGKIPPSQLVNMSFEDLAPSELKNWRENEKKTSIELIKREAVDQANQVIMKKTHKGEFISGKNDLISELAVPDSVVNHETESTSTDFNSSAEVPKPIVLKAEVVSSKVMSITLSPVNQPTQTEPHSKSYSIDAAASISQDQQVSSANQGSYEPKQRSDVLNDTIMKEKSISSAPAISQIVKESTVRIGDETSIRSKPIRIRVEPDMSKILAQADKLLEKNSQAIMSRNNSITNSKPTAATVSPRKSHKPDISKLPGHHSSRNVELPPVWTGQISMPDQAKFFASAHVISGNLGANLSEEAGKLLLIAGRISPEQVADYITKLRASRQTEVGVLKFKFVTREERTGYDAFYHYLNARNRYGVVATASAKTYKEFYIMPLGMNHDVPKVLLPFKGAGLESKPRRENLLLGILIRTSKGHSGLTIIPTVSMAATGSSNQAAATSPERSYTPPLLNSGNTIPSNHVDDGSYTPPYMPPSIVASSSKRQKNDYGSKSFHEPSSSKIPKYDPDEVKVKKTKNSAAVAVTSASTSKNGLSFNDQEFLDYFANCSNSEEMLNAIDNSGDSASLGAILEQMTNKTDNKRRLLEIDTKVAQETNEASSNGQGSNGNVVSLNSKLISTIQIPDNLKDILKNVHDATIHAKSGQPPVNEIGNDANNASYKAMQSDPKCMRSNQEQPKQTNPGPQAVTHMSQNELLLKAQEQFNALAKLENSSSERVTGGFCPPPPILQHSQHLRGIDRTQAQSFMPTSLQLPSQPPAILAPNGNNGSRMNEPGQNMYADYRRQQLPPLQPSPGPNQAGIPPTHPTISFGWKRRRT